MASSSLVVESDLLFVAQSRRDLPAKSVAVLTLSRHGVVGRTFHRAHDPVQTTVPETTYYAAGDFWLVGFSSDANNSLSR